MAVRSGPAVALAAGLVQEAASPTGDREFVGMVKSYNARRGFGFVACSETAQIFGRDVYIAKVEAQLAYEEGMMPEQVAILRAAIADKVQTPIINEEDLIHFRVRVSAEGHPQAEQIRRLYKFQGTVVQPPPQAEDDDAAAAGRIVSDELAVAFGGQREVVLRRADCGQAMLASGDRVTFCVLMEEPMVSVGANVWLRQAALVCPVPQQHQLQGSILGCFTLLLPRPPALGPVTWRHRHQPPVAVPRADLLLDCHAIRDRIIVSGLPADIDEPELMRFFSKHGAEGAALAQSRSGIFASITFPSIAEVSRFVSRSLHTFADDKETRLARLLPCGHGAANGAHSILPGLPQPMLMPGEQGSLMVGWSPVVLASGYRVEVRQVGSQGPWCAVDPTTGGLVDDASATFGKEATWCRVRGLSPAANWEARINYVSACGCWSDASESAQLRVGAAPPMMATMAPMMHNGRALTVLPQGACGGCSGCTPCRSPVPAPWPQAGGSPQSAMQLPGMVTQPAAWSPQHQQPILSHSPQSHLSTSPPTLPGWHCMHGSPLLPPSAPEIKDADGNGFALVVQWPAVATATAYVVELKEIGTDRVERFVRNVPGEAVGTIVELRVGGLRPAGGAGRRYTAQVRSVAACGCESEASPAGVSLPIGADQPALQLPLQREMQQPSQPIVQVSLAAVCGLTSQAGSPVASPSKDEAKLGRQLESPPAPAGRAGQLPSLLGGPRKPTLLGGSPVAATTAGVPEKPTFPDESDEEEDCIILD